VMDERSTASQQAVSKTPRKGLAVSGYSEAFLKPDYAVICIIFETFEKELAPARKWLQQKTEAFSKSLLAEPFKLLQAHIVPEYTSIPSKQDITRSATSHYQLQRRIQLTLRNLVLFEALMDHVVAVYGDVARVETVYFYSDQERAIRSEQEIRATENAKAKAEVLVSKLGSRIGKPISISNLECRTVPFYDSKLAPVTNTPLMNQIAASPRPLAESGIGYITVVASVNVLFAIE